MEARERLRLLSLEMEMQRAWLAAFLDDEETRAAMRRNNMLLSAVMSVAKTRSLWLDGIGMEEIGRRAGCASHRRRPTRPHRSTARRKTPCRIHRLVCG